MKRKNLLSLLLAIILVLGMTVPTMAVNGVQNVYITGSKTVHVGNTIELDSRISPGYLDLRDSEYTWSSSNSSIAKVLVTHDEDTKIKGAKAGTATITVRINGTNVKATYKVTVKKAKKVSTSAATKKIKKYRKNAKKIRKNIKNLKLASTYAGQRNQHYKFVTRIKSIENKLDRLDNNWERKYEMGKISYAKYNTIELKVERVENYLEIVEDYLDAKFSYMFDD